MTFLSQLAIGLSVLINLGFLCRWLIRFVSTPQPLAVRAVFALGRLARWVESIYVASDKAVEIYYANQERERVRPLCARKAEA